MYFPGLYLVNMETFVVQRKSRSAQLSMVYTTLAREHLILKKWRPAKSYNSDEQTDKQLRCALFVTSDTKLMLFRTLHTSCCFKCQPGRFFALEKLCWTLDESHRNAFSRLAKAIQQFLCRKAPCWAILENHIQMSSFVTLLFSNKATICISSQFTDEQSHLWFYCENASSNFVIRCEVKFSRVRRTCDFQEKCTWVQSLLTTRENFLIFLLLETNLASSVKPSNMKVWKR